MYYNTHRAHGGPYASYGATPVSCDINGARQCLIDMEPAPPVRLTEETRRVMDQLLRECLKRKPLS